MSEISFWQAPPKRDMVSNPYPCESITSGDKDTLDKPEEAYDK